MGIFGFLFFLLDIYIYFLSTLNNLLSTGFGTKHSLIHQVGDHICILENCVSVVSMIGYFSYIFLEGNRVLTLNLTLMESTSEMYSQKFYA